MKTTALGHVLLLAALRCSSQGEKHEQASAPPASITTPRPVVASARPAATSDGGAEVASVEKIDQFLTERYSDLIPRSEQQLEAVSAADRYVDKTSLVPRPRRYLVRKTSAGWDVTVMSLEDLRRAEVNHKGGVIVSVTATRGQLEGVSLKVQE